MKHTKQCRFVMNDMKHLNYCTFDITIDKKTIILNSLSKFIYIISHEENFSL